jgi:hypothetical protein
VDNIKINLNEVGWGDMDWIDPAHYRDKRRDIGNMAMNLRVHKIFGNS